LGVDSLTKYRNYNLGGAVGVNSQEYCFGGPVTARIGDNYPPQASSTLFFYECLVPRWTGEPLKNKEEDVLGKPQRRGAVNRKGQKESKGEGDLRGEKTNKE